MTLRRPFLWLALCWTLMILVLLSIPGSNLPDASLLEYDKLAHAGLFFVLTILWLLALAARSTLKGVLIFVAIVAFSFGSEWYQEQLPFDRTADAMDAVADSIGALLGFSLWVLKNALIRTDAQ